MKNTKEYLLQIKKIDTVIENKIAEAQHWKDVALGITSYSDGERVQSSGSLQKMSDAVCRYVVLEEEVNAEIDKLVKKRKEIIATIEKLPVTEYNVLFQIYINHKDFQQVADAEDKSYSWATTVHGRALRNLKRVLDERNRND